MVSMTPGHATQSSGLMCEFVGVRCFDCDTEDMHSEGSCLLGTYRWMGLGVTTVFGGNLPSFLLPL